MSISNRLFVSCSLKMHLHLFPKIYFSISILIVSLILTCIPNSSVFAQDNEQIVACKTSFHCANMEVWYPFWGSNRPEYCGHPEFELNCSGEAPVITINSLGYRVLHIDSGAHLLTVARTNYWNNACPEVPQNATLNVTFFDYTSDTQDLTLYYGCPDSTATTTVPSQFSCPEDGTNHTNFYATDAMNLLELDLQNCQEKAVVRISDSAAKVLEEGTTISRANLSAALDSGFGIKWEANNSRCEECVKSEGVCGSNIKTYEFICYCKDRSYGFMCGSDHSNSENEQYVACNTGFHCANMEVWYPFWGSNRPEYCGHPDFELNCSGEAPVITISSLRYRVLQIDSGEHLLKVARTDYWNNTCPEDHKTASLNLTFSYTSDTQNLTLYYSCPGSAVTAIPYQFSCPGSGTTVVYNYYVTESINVFNVDLQACEDSAIVRISNSAAGDLEKGTTVSPANLTAALDSGFGIEWDANNSRCEECVKSEGVCGFNLTTGEFNCFCKDRPYGIMCGSDQYASGFDWYATCSNKYRCGIIEADFPFWGDGRPEGCGYPGLKLNCEKNNATIEIKRVKYQVLEVDQEGQIFKIARTDYMNGICSPKYGNTALDPELFEYAPASGDITLFYGCSSETNLYMGGFTCSNEKGYIVPGSNGSAGAALVCRSRVTARVPDPVRNYGEVGNVSVIEKALVEGFRVKYKVDFEACVECKNSNGVCGYDWTVNETTCYCRNDPSVLLKACPLTPGAGDISETPDNKTGSPSKRKYWIIGISAALSGFIMLSVVLIYYCRECKSNDVLRVSWKKNKRDEFNIEAFISEYGSFAPKRYSYAHVKGMTNTFAEKIGEGGYGAVYKGKLSDGRLVAVKVLHESKTSNGEEFINEVASIGRTSHVNVVTLLGFCYERTKRALVYEYMPNGSLDKFIFNQESSSTNCHLEWKTLYEIAIGIARGLQYLHRGCNTRILHFDIKPQNILLDKDFCPKISDFGLAKLCLTKESIVSMGGARGTIGYIAPEVFSRTYGGVSHKSDVYSYGMLILEMVGGRKNFDSAASHTSQIFFPNQLFKDIEMGNEASMLENITAEEKEISRKMILVSFWCIQTNPGDRPPISKVVDMLEGTLESIEFPPKPYLFSPTRSP